MVKCGGVVGIYHEVTVPALSLRTLQDRWEVDSITKVKSPALSQTTRQERGTFGQFVVTCFSSIFGLVPQRRG